MRILEINGSPRRNGNTQAILDICNDQFERIEKSTNRKIEYEIIHIYDENLEWCKGCRTCFDVSEEKCPHKDKLLLIREKMEQADLIIVGSPVYVEDVSGGMKNFLDRMAFNCHRPFLKQKGVYCFTTSGGTASSHTLKTIKRAFLSWGGRAITTDQYRMGEKSDPDSAREHFGKRIEGNIQKILRQSVSNKVTLYSLLVFNIQKDYWGRQEGTADYEYWKEQGWLKSDCTYYVDNVKITIIKRGIARIISSIVGKCIR